MSSLDNATPGGIITGLAQLQMHHTIFLKRKMGYSSDKAKRTGINDEVKEKTNKNNWTEKRKTNPSMTPGGGGGQFANYQNIFKKSMDTWCISLR